MSKLHSLITRFYDKVILKWPGVVILFLLAVVSFLGYKAQDFKLDASAETLILETDEDLRYSRLIESRYGYEWEGEDVLRILPAPIIRGVVTDIQNRVPVARIGAKFHSTLIYLFADLCDLIRASRGLNRVVLSGGCFQNATLLSGLIQALEKRNFQIFSHHQVPTNDGGISLGQAVVAAAKLRL